MPAPEITRERLSFSQTRKVKWRFRANKRDRFKRLYVVWLDRNNSEPTGQIERAFNVPMTNEGIPLDIPDNFLKFPEDEAWRVEVDFLGYAAYMKRALAEWEARLELYISQSARGEPIKKAHDKAGPKPLPWQLFVLMHRGDPWCLGFSAKRTPAVESIIGKAPTRKQLWEQARRGPKELELGDELEALLANAPATVSGFIDEVPDDAPISREKITSRFKQVSPAEFDQENGAADEDDDDLEDEQAELAARKFLDTNTGQGAGDQHDDDDDEDDDQEEGVLTGDIDLDEAGPGGLGNEPVWNEAALEQLAGDLEERHDPGATGGKKQDPRKNRTRPGKE